MWRTKAAAERERERDCEWEKMRLGLFGTENRVFVCLLGWMSFSCRAVAERRENGREKRNGGEREK